jgi:poly(ADP-ribose) glycohydrolase ARH3
MLHTEGALCAGRNSLSVVLMRHQLNRALRAAASSGTAPCSPYRKVRQQEKVCPQEQEMTEERLRSKFVGALLGTFVGDALGMPFENWPPERIARDCGTPDRMLGARLWLRGYAVTFGALHGSFGGAPLGRGTYTDDTQMMIGVAESLAACGGFDGADMARRFVENYDPRRGYGPGATKAIGGLRRGLPWDEVGKQLFNGTGSFGNGAAMRAAPVGLLYHDDPAALRRLAELQASITHAHPLGREGAALQAFAVACALQREPGEGFDAAQFLAELRGFVPGDCEVFQNKLAQVADLLARQPAIREVVDALGNNVTAQGSVPAALYAFLANNRSFRDAVVYAVSLGGDTDTIGAMAGAVAGALHGVKAIPSDWWDALENGPKGRDYVQQLTEALFRHRAARALKGPGPPG